MNRQPFEKPPQWWSPRLSPRWIRFWRPFRRRDQLRRQRLLEVEVRGATGVRELLKHDTGVLITPNHSSHADCFSLYEAAEHIGQPFYIMVAWQVFQRGHRLRRLVLRHHGCFSVDREGTDLKAIRQACEVLQAKRQPLVIFPEGEVYHLNDRTTPFREGPAAIALMAVKKATRPIACIPCAMKYEYIQDPTSELLELMGRLERALLWRPRTDLTLDRRIYHFAEALLALKEIELFGHSRGGSLPDRIHVMLEFLLGRIEARHGLSNGEASTPERIKVARQHVIARLQELPANDPGQQVLIEELDDLFLVVQVFSYPGNYVAEKPSIERMAETLDKFEEDVLGVKTATIRGARRAIVTFGAPILIQPEMRRMGAAAITRMLESKVQELLDGHSTAGPGNRFSACGDPGGADSNRRGGHGGSAEGDRFFS